MRVGIYTNRLPYPPIGGIPRFLHGLTEALTTLGANVEFLIPNLKNSNNGDIIHENSQSSIEAKLALESIDLSKSIPVIPQQDVIIYFSKNEPNSYFKNKPIHPLYEEKTENIIAVVSCLDYLIIAGSSLLLINHNQIINLVLETSIPTILVILFPLSEIEFYGGSLVRDSIANKISTLANICRCVVVPSAYVEQEIRVYCQIKNPIVKIPPGINLHEFYDSEPKNYKSKNVITISRLGHFAKHKNIKSLLEAWPLVRGKIPEATLTLVGSIPTFSTEYEEYLFAQEGLILPGEVPDAEKIKLLHKSRVFALPSSIEAFGFSFLEALAAGVPVIGLRSTAIPELVKDGENGLLLEPQEIKRQIFETEVVHWKPDISELAISIIQFLTDDLLYEKNRENCFNSVKSLDWSSSARDYLALYSKL